MKIPILYDFKRSFLRISTIIILVVAIALGISLSYLTYIMLLQTQLINSVALHIEKDGECTIIGTIFDRKGTLIDGEINIIRNGMIIYSTSSRKGVYMATGSQLCGETPDSIEIRTNVMNFNITRYRGERIYQLYISLLGIEERWKGVEFPEDTFFTVYGSPDAWILVNDTIAVFKLFTISRRTGHSILIVLSANISSIDLKPDLLIYYSTYRAFLSSEDSFKNLSTSYRTLEIKNIVEVYHIDLDPYNDTMILTLEKEGAIGMNTISYGGISFEQMYIEMALGSGGMNILVAFFPIVMIYLVNTLFAKPKESGALEFILARPVTRFDIYLLRYLSGVLTALSSATLYVVSIAVSSAIIFGITLDLSSYIVLVLGLSASFIMFYTLCYTLASVTRGKTYLAIALALYILFAFLWTFIQFAIALALNIPLMGKEFTELGHRLSHINPINYIDVVQYFIKLKYDLTQEISVANPYISIAVPIAWIVVLFIIGYKIFKKIDL